MTIEKDKQNNDEEIDKFSSILSAMQNDNPFVIPESYFDELPAVIQDRCLKLKKESPYLLFIKHSFVNPQFYISVGVLLIAIVIFSLYFEPIQKNQITLAQNIDVETKVNELIDENQIDEAMIIESIVSDTDTVKVIKQNTQLNISKQNLSIENPEITPDDILQYLLDNEAEIEPNENL